MTRASSTAAENESEILEIIHGYLETNKIMDVDKVISHVNRVLAHQGSSYSRRGIERVVDGFINKMLLVEGSRLTRSTLLKNPKRKLIFNYLRDNPGAYHYQIVKDLVIPSHIVIWHVDALKKFGCIKETSFQNHVLFYLTIQTPLDAIRGYLSRNEKAIRIVQGIQEAGDACTKNQLATRLKMHPGTVKKYLNDLVKVSLVKRTSAHRKTLYTLP